MTGFEALLAFLVLLGPLIFVHELGHFLAAKLFGVRVEVFSLGFGPRLAGIRRGETDYRIAPIPLGGYVRMSGEHAAPGDRRDPRSLTSKPRWQRLVILAAGPAVNIVFAGCVWWGLFMHGFDVPDIPEGPPVVEAVEPGSPAAESGVVAGDRIVKIAGRELASIRDMTEEVVFRGGQETAYLLERDGRPHEVTITIGRDPETQIGWDGIYPQLPIAFGRIFPDSPAEMAGLAEGDRLLAVDGEALESRVELIEYIEARTGRPIRLTVLRDDRPRAIVVTPRANDEGRGKIGAEIGAPLRHVAYGPVEAAGEALREIGRQSGLLYRSVKAIATRALGLSALSGPLEIARIAREQISLGWLPFFALMAGLSLQLGLLNLLPIPVLDGGQILLISIEGIRGRDLAPALREKVLIAGLLMIVLLMATVIGLDLFKLKRSAEAAAPPVEATEPAPPPD